jgi:uncharacterized C2H2 Zn-finger protein
METYSEPVVDRDGNVMFWCDHCGAPISRADILNLGLRLPESGETVEDYRDAELIDSFRHPRCVGAMRAG